MEDKGVIGSILIVVGMVVAVFAIITTIFVLAGKFPVFMEKVKRVICWPFVKAWRGISWPARKLSSWILSRKSEDEEILETITEVVKTLGKEEKK